MHVYRNMSTMTCHGFTESYVFNLRQLNNRKGFGIGQMASRPLKVSGTRKHEVPVGISA